MSSTVEIRYSPRYNKLFIVHVYEVTETGARIIIDSEECQNNCLSSIVPTDHWNEFKRDCPKIGDFE